MGDITVLLGRARDGDRGAFDGLFDALYPGLRRIAHARLASHQRNTMLNTTVLVHECFLKFTAADRLTPKDRAHFLAYGSQMMRSIIVDVARARQAEQRGGDAALAVSSPVASAATDTAAGGGWTLVIPFVGSVTFFGPGGVIGFTGITQMGGG